jgi:DNA adenine methylase
MIGRAALYAANAVIEQLDWRECIRRYDKPETLFYCDPP